MTKPLAAILTKTKTSFSSAQYERMKYVKKRKHLTTSSNLLIRNVVVKDCST